MFLTGLTQTTSSGATLGGAYRDMVEVSGVHITLGPLGDSWGAYRARENVITINQRALREDPRALAVVLAHEITHAWQVANGYGRSLDCVAMEVRAYMAGSVVWMQLWNGYGPERTVLEQQLNRQAQTMMTEGEPGLYKYVVDNPGYQEQCALWEP